MEIKNPKIKSLIILGIIGISLVAISIDFVAGKELALVGLTGLIALTKSE